MNWKNVLHQHGLKITSGRINVLETLEFAKEPMDISAMHDLLVRKKIKCDLVTVYRIMETLVAKGIITQIDFQDGKKRYEIEGEHHHHLICTQCGIIQPIHEPCVAVSEQTVKDKYGFTITRHQLEFYGACDQCEKQA